MKVSIITVVYNRVESIADCVASVRLQTYPDLEYVVVNGASTDGTSEMLDRLSDQIDVYVNEPDKGIYDALNKALSLATGDVIGLLHSDDVFEDPQVIADVVARFEEPSTRLVYGDLQYVAKTDLSRVIRCWVSCPFVPRLLKRGWMPPHPTLFVHRAAYQAVGGYNTSYRIAADYDFVLRYFLRFGKQSRYVPRVLVRMRVGGASNRSLHNLMKKTLEDYRILRTHGVGGVIGLLWKNLSKVGQFLA
jgi:glycosyltransferase involved in cell wall biosynthesis